VFLSLDTITPNRDVALSLPGEVARRYRALPVARDNGRVTVVMANPADQAARQAVTAALLSRSTDAAGSVLSVTIVQGDPAEIDAWLAELWPVSQAQAELHVWLREPLHGEKETAEAFAEAIARILGATLSRFNPVTDDLPQAVRTSANALVLLPCADYGLRNHLLQSGEADGPAVLIGCRARWPLHKLLVIVRGDQVDDLALTWAARLARPSGATVTALMVAPSASPGQGEASDEGIPALLATTSLTGRKMKHAAERLAALQLDATLHLRQGVPEAVIREELAAGAYDLAITGLAVRGGEARWRLRPFLDRLLLDVSCPLLIVRSDG
jgi:nucleotide-binding universal stress UspA family protein